MIIVRMPSDHFAIVVLCVDHMLLHENNKEIMKKVKSQPSSQFDMKYLRVINFILGMELKVTI